MTQGIATLDPSQALAVSGFELTRTGVIVPSGATEDQWRQAWGFVKHAECAVMWWIGDMLNAAQSKWGETYKQAMEESGYSKSTLAAAKSVSASVESCIRMQDLPWGHHQIIAPLPPAQQKKWLERAASECMTVAGLRNAVKSRALENRIEHDSEHSDSLESIIASGAKFSCVYADPPWQYDNQATRASTDNHYSTMTVEAIAELPIPELVAERALLFLWTTNGFLFESKQVIDAWGFEFKSSIIWAKPQIGIGNYVRNAHEFLLIASRGGMRTTGTASSQSSWIVADRTEHSCKPEAFRQVVQNISDGPRIELFARERIQGWTVWGNQISKQTKMELSASPAAD